MSLVQRFQQVSERLQAIPARLGVPQYSEIVLSNQGTQLYLGKLKILQLSERDVVNYQGAGVDVNLDDKALYIPRTYELELLQRATILVNAYYTESGLWAGVRHLVQHVGTNNILEYKVILQALRPR